MTDPLFDPDRQEACSLPSTPAVRFQFVSDCLILPAPAPIFDCPDIDIAPDAPPPRPSFLTISQIITEDLDLGPGADGEDCVPAGTGSCVIWVWCECDTSSSGSLSESTASAPSEGSSEDSEEDTECPVYTCEDASSGQWVNMATGAPWTPSDGAGPCHAGRMFGEAMKICECPTIPCPICAYYPFDDYPLFPPPNGRAVDVSGSGLHLTEGATIPASLSGKIVLARTFDGVYDVLEHADNPCFSLGLGGTVWGWMRYSLTTNISHHIIAIKGTQAFHGDTEWLIFNDVSGYAHEGSLLGGVRSNDGILWGPTGIDIGTSGLGVRDNWFFIAMWADPATMEVGFRVNNTTMTVLASGTAFSTRTPGVALGNYYGGGVDPFWKPYKGDLDEWGFASCALSTAQLDALYNGGAGVDYPAATEIVF